MATREQKIAALAAHIKPILDAEVDRYRQACEVDAANGHRPHYCPHGMNLWTDHDPICGHCESEGFNGIPMYWETTLRAQIAAEEGLAEYERIQSLLAQVWTSIAPLYGIVSDPTLGEIMKNLGAAVFSSQLKVLWYLHPKDLENLANE